MEAAGPEYFSYSWRRVGDPAELASWTSLSLSGVDPTNSGLYQVIVNNNNNGAVTGPTNVSFWWRLSAAAEACLDIAVDGVVSNTISGETAWQKQSLALEAGEHTLTWTFRKNNASSAGADAAWVDQFTFGTGNSSSNSSRVLHLRKRDQTKKCGLNAQQRKAG